MTHNFLKLMSPLIFVIDVGLILFFHDRLVPIIEVWLPDSDELVFSSFTNSDLLAAVLIAIFLGGQVISAYLLFFSTPRLWDDPEHTPGGFVLRAVCVGIIAMVPLAEMGLSLKLFAAQQDDVFGALRTSTPSLVDHIINVGLGVIIGLVTVLASLLSANVIALAVKRRDVVDAEAFMAKKAADVPAEEPATFSPTRKAS